MIVDIFNFISDAVSKFSINIVDLFRNIAQLFVEVDTVSGDVTGLTFIGILALIGFGLALVRWGFSLIMRLIKMGGKA